MHRPRPATAMLCSEQLHGQARLIGHTSGRRTMSPARRSQRARELVIRRQSFCHGFDSCPILRKAARTRANETHLRTRNFNRWRTGRDPCDLSRHSWLITIFPCLLPSLLNACHMRVLSYAHPRWSSVQGVDVVSPTMDRCVSMKGGVLLRWIAPGTGRQCLVALSVGTALRQSTCVRRVGWKTRPRANRVAGPSHEEGFSTIDTLVL